MHISESLVIAVPKGRILKELMPLLKQVGLQPEPSFFDENSRALSFRTNHPNVSFIRVRSFDVATFVAFGAAQLGIVGSDVLAEFDYDDIYAPIDLGIGICRLSLAANEDINHNFQKDSHIKVATKYPKLTASFFAQMGVQAECIKLQGAMELAPKLGLSQYIVDLVSTGTTLKQNGLKELEVMMHVSSRLAVNRLAFKTQQALMAPWIEKFRKVIQ